MSLVVVLALMALVGARQAMSQPPTPRYEAPVSIIYGYVTHHYLTTWEDRNLPAGVLRGLHPSIASHQGDERENQPSSTQKGEDATLPKPTDQQPPQDAAILYQLDLGERGMQMMVSTKTGLRPGHCIALERRGATSNLRRVSPAFCEPANGAVIDKLETVRAAQAEHCMQALWRIHNSAPANKSMNPLPEIQMLCDGG